MPLPQVPLRHTCLRFDAGAAQAWTALDVLPNEARVWRAGGHDPATAAPVLAGTPPDATRIPPGDYHWSMVGAPTSPPANPSTSTTRRYAPPCTIPPGTRGSYAEDRQRFGHHRS